MSEEKLVYYVYGVESVEGGAPLPLREALDAVARVAAQYAVRGCLCAACPGPRAGRVVPGGLCPTCRAAGCNPWRGVARCREAGGE